MVRIIDDIAKSQTAARREQLRRTKGWRMPANAVKVDRTTPWGNPFRVGLHGDAAECVAGLERLLAGHWVRGNAPPVEEQRRYREHAFAHRGELMDKVLMCWCPLDAPCHGNALAAFANEAGE